MDRFVYSCLPGSTKISKFSFQLLIFKRVIFDKKTGGVGLTPLPRPLGLQGLNCLGLSSPSGSGSLILITKSQTENLCIVKRGELDQTSAY